MRSSSTCAVSVHARRVEGNRKCEGRARPIVPFDPKTATMSLDDGTAHGEADSHAATLGRVERLEQFVRVLEIETDAGIADRHTDSIAFVPLLC